MTTPPRMMEGSTFTIPFLGDLQGVYKIGELWNCTTSSPKSGNIFIQDRVEKPEFLDVQPNSSTVYQIMKVMDSNGKTTLMDFSAEFKIEVKSIIVTGAANFNKENTRSLLDEEFLCKHEVQTAVLRTRPSAYKVVNPIIKQGLLDGSIDATHYVSEIRYGGSVYATFRASESKSHDELGFGGSLQVKFPVFPALDVNASIKAGFSFLDKSSNYSYQSSIVVDSFPPLSSADKEAIQPTSMTLDEMFDQVSSLPAKVGKIQDYPDLFPSLRGVPILFKLSPVTELLIDVDEETGEISQHVPAKDPTYILLEGEVLDQFTNMIYTLHDFEGPHFYRQLLRDEDYRLSYIFPVEGQDGNPWAAEVLKEEDRLRSLAKGLSQTAMDTFQMYKKGKAKLEDIIGRLQEYEHTFCYPDILKSVDREVEMGRSLLSPLRLADATISGIPDLFIFSMDEYDEYWTQDKEGYRLLLTTNGQAPMGAVVQLYAIAQAAQSWDLQLKVAVPNIVDDFSLSLKGFETLIFEVKYTGEEILFFANLLGAILKAKVRDHLNSSKFYSMIAVQEGRKKPSHLELADLKDFVDGMRSLTEHMLIANTYLQTLEAISLATAESESASWTLVIPSQFITVLHSSLQLYRWMSKELKKGGVGFNTVVGYYNNQDKKGSPLLLVYGKNSTLKGIICNHLDGMILTNLLVNNNPDLTLLSPQSVPTNSLSPDSVEVAHEISSLSSSDYFLPPLITSPFDKLIDPERIESDTQAFDRAEDILHEACYATPWTLLSTLITYLLPTHSKKLLPIFRRQGWSEMVGLEERSEEELDNLVRDLDDFQNKYYHISDTVEGILSRITSATNSSNPPFNKDLILNCFKDPTLGNELEPFYPMAEAYLNNVEDIGLAEIVNLKGFLRPYDLSDSERDQKNLLDTFYTGLRFARNISDESLLQSIIKYFIDHCSMEETQRSDIYAAIEADFFEEAAGLLRYFKYDNNLHLLHQTMSVALSKYDGIEDLDRVINVVEVVGGFSPEQQEWVWGNPKFQYWIRIFQTSQPLIAKILEVYSSDGDTPIPDWMPFFVKAQVNQLANKILGLGYEWSTVWDSKEEMIVAFRGILARGLLPPDFNSVLLDNLNGNITLVKYLEGVDGVLDYWNLEEGLFSECWSLEDVRKVVNQTLGEAQTLLKSEIKMQSTLPLEYNPPEDEPDSLTLKEPWTRFSTHNQLNYVKYGDFVKFHETSSSPPSIPSDNPEELKTAVDKIGSYIWKELKINNPESLNVSDVANYFSFPNYTISENVAESSLIGCLKSSKTERLAASTSFHISRSDWLTLVVTGVTSGSTAQLLEVMSDSGSHALPLYIPDITGASDYKSLAHYLSSIDLNRHFAGQLTQSKLLTAPYKLLVAIRVGPNPLGKSTLLNQSIFSSKTPYMFSSRLDPGAENGESLARKGLVELMWLAESNIKTNLYLNSVQKYYNSNNKMILLANVNGDVFDLPETLIDELLAQSAGFLVFSTGKSWIDLQKNNKRLKTLLRNGSMYHLIVDPDPKSELLLNPASFLKLGESENPTKVQAVLHEMIFKTSSAKTETPTQQMNNPLKELMDFIEKRSIELVRESFKLQNIQGPISDDIFNSIHTQPIWVKSITLFCQILSLPLQQRLATLYKLEKELGYLSQKSSAVSLSHILNLEQEVKVRVTKGTVGMLRTEVNRYHKLTLTPQHFYREISIYFQQLITKGSDNQPEEEYRKILQENFYHGSSFELFNYRLGNVMWDFPVEMCFESLPSDTRLFVLSTLGLKGSGKSTLLNNLFGKGFRTGPGGSTHGIISKLLFLDPPFKDRMGIDAILLLDSEGLNRPENTFDLEGQTKERQLATFLLGISHLCLVPVNDVVERPTEKNTPNPKEFDEIVNYLEMGLLSLALKDNLPVMSNCIGIRPKDDPEVRKELEQKMFQSLNSLSTTLEEKGGKLGYVNLSSQVCRPIHHKLFSETFFLTIGKEGWRKEVHKVLESEMKEAGEDTAAEWYQKTKSLWVQILADPFLKFKNLAELNTSLKLGSDLSQIKTKIESTFMDHESEIIEARKLMAEQNDEEPRVFGHLSKSDIKQINKVPFACTQTQCKCSETLKVLQEFLRKLEIGLEYDQIPEDLDRYTDNVRKTLLSQLEQRAYTSEIRDGLPNGPLQTYLNELIQKNPTDTNAKLWIHFKRFVSTKIEICPWSTRIISEVETEYCSSFRAKLVKEPDLENACAFYTKPYVSEGQQRPFQPQVPGDQLSWEKLTWFKLSLKDMVRRMDLLFPVDTYHSGMVTHLQQLLTSVQEDLLLDNPYPAILPDFQYKLHSTGILYFLRVWEERFTVWTNEWNPLEQLELKKDSFPHTLFKPPKLVGA